MENRRVEIGIVIFGQNHLFLGISAANRGTIGVAAGNNLSGTDALDPGDFLGDADCRRGA